MIKWKSGNVLEIIALQPFSGIHQWISITTFALNKSKSLCKTFVYFFEVMLLIILPGLQADMYRVSA